MTDLCKSLNVTNLNSVVKFPNEVGRLAQICEDIASKDSKKMRSIFNANIAEAINNAKVFVVKGELATSMADMASTKKYYTACQQQNSVLIEEYNKRRNNHEELKNLLRELNGFINKAASVRVGETKQRVIQ